MNIENEIYKLLYKSKENILYSNPDIFFTNYHEENKLENKDKKTFLNKIYKFFKQYFVFNKIYYVKNFDKKLDVLFLSHHAYKNKKLKDKDFYFGSLPLTLKKHNINVAISMLNKSYEDEGKILNFYNESKVPRIILPNKINFFFEIAHILKINLNFFLIKFFKKNYQVIFNYINFKTSLKTLDIERTKYQINKILKKYKPKIFIFTFEGHALERQLINISKKNKSYCIGYYFAVIKKKKNFSFKNFDEQFMPNEIITSGNYSKKFFNKVNIKKLNIYGSNRFQFSLNIKNNKCKKTILVAPEGVISETKYMLSFAKKCSQIYPNYKFIFRTHPDITKKLMINHNFILTTSRKNLIISNKELMEDIKVASFILYRGSSVVITSCINNLKPIYLKKSGELISHDPLYEINKNVIVSPIELRRYIENIAQNHTCMSKNFCYRYFASEKNSTYAQYLIEKLKNV